jgi:hypothetical protein
MKPLDDAEVVDIDNQEWFIRPDVTPTPNNETIGAGRRDASESG